MDNENARPRRVRSDKSGFRSTLEKLKQIKQSGAKHRYEDEEEKPVYSMVDEDEYSKIVNERQQDDWLVDDDGSGYVEDGRDFFDEDDELPLQKKDKAAKPAKNANIKRPATTIESMFAAGSHSKPKRERRAKERPEDDDLLKEMLSELHQPTNEQPAPLKDVFNQNQNSLFDGPPVALKATAVRLAASRYDASSNADWSKAPPAPVQSAVGVQRFNQSSVSILAAPPTPAVSATNHVTTSAATAWREADIRSESALRSETAPKVATIDEPTISHFDAADDDSCSASWFEAEATVATTNKRCDGDSDRNVGEVVAKTTALAPAFDEADLSAEWQETLRQQNSVGTSSDAVEICASMESTGDVLKFFWLDAHEDFIKHPGVVYLFGKTFRNQQCVSCCLVVRNIERQVFLLPRENKLCDDGSNSESVSFLDVYEEFDNDIAVRYRITKFKSRKVEKMYAFDKVDVPNAAEYLEIKYAADCEQLPADLTGRTFSHVFGTASSSLELFLLERKIKGPCWLEVRGALPNNPLVSWCSTEMHVTCPSAVDVVTERLDAPPLTLLTLSSLSVPSINGHHAEPVLVSCLVHQNFRLDKPPTKKSGNWFERHFTLLAKPHGVVFPFDFNARVQKEGKTANIDLLNDERSLLCLLLGKLQSFDPDLIIGHDLIDHELEELLQRADTLKVPNWSRLARLRRATLPKGHTLSRIAQVFAGRLLCDAKLSAKELIRCKSYDLTQLAASVLHVERALPIAGQLLRNHWLASDDLIRLVQMRQLDATYCLRIVYELNAIPLALQVTGICGNVLSRTFLGGRAERNEYLLLHAFHARNYLLPDKTMYVRRSGEGNTQASQASVKRAAAVADDSDDPDDALDMPEKGSAAAGRRKPQYMGGLVLEPKRGFYDKYILLLDFNSLYPSIIQEYNVCFTTVNRQQVFAQSDEALANIQFQGDAGILPTEIRKLVDSRRQVKNLMKTPNQSEDLMMQYDIRQKALKLTANSMYGCLGFGHSRFYAKPLAAVITARGRDALLRTKELVEKMNLEVIYGDTDSIMINSNCTELDDVFKLGNKVKLEVNKLFRLLEIELDGVFKCMLLLKKKKYAALAVERLPDGTLRTHQELKGLDIVRRDWSQIAVDAGRFVVNQLLSGESRDTVMETIHSKLTDVGNKLRGDLASLPVSLFAITKQLTKAPESYPDRKALPHVQVALRLNDCAERSKKLKAGDTVSYIICGDGTSNSATQRAYDSDELRSNTSLSIDVNYYLAHQILPVVQRLCEPIPDTDASRIAECLGLDPSNYRHVPGAASVDNDALVNFAPMLSVDDETRFADCERLRLRCPYSTCKRDFLVDSVFVGQGSFAELLLAKCPHEQCRRPIMPAPRSEDASDSLRVAYIHNCVQLAVRNHISRYYMNWVRCEDPMCDYRTRKVSLHFLHGGLPLCPKCQNASLQLEFTNLQLYTQLCYYDWLFDVDKAIANFGSSKSDREAAALKADYNIEVYRSIKQLVGRYLQRNAFKDVNLTDIFSYFSRLKCG